MRRVTFKQIRNMYPQIGRGSLMSLMRNLSIEFVGTEVRRGRKTRVYDTDKLPLLTENVERLYYIQQERHRRAQSCQNERE
jgi:hypothetical protein